MKLSLKQNELRKKIIAPNIPKISVLGSEQSGKTFAICLATMQYAEELYKYDPVKEYYGAIIGWDIETLKSNIGETFEFLFNQMNFKDYDLRFANNDKYLKIFNMTFFFFSFNTKLSFNKIQGKPLIYIWIDESARIYTQNSLQEDFDKFPGRQISFSGHPYKKTIHSFNVEGNSHHPYKVKYLDNTDAVKFEFVPYDNPLIDTKEKYEAVINTYPEGSALREQKIYNRWVVAEGRVFTEVNKIKNLEGLHITEIGIGVDYGNVNPTAFVPIALCYDNIERRYKAVRLGIYYHDSGQDENKPTTAWYVEQEKSFINYLMKQYPNVPIYDNVVDSEAIHFTNALYNAGVEYSLARKGSGSVDTGVQQMQSLFYKKVLYTLEEKTITRFNGDIPEYAIEDIGIIELEGYQYDRQKSITSGQNCYVKAEDHSIDAERYLISEWQYQGKLLTI